MYQHHRFYRLSMHNTMHVFAHICLHMDAHTCANGCATPCANVCTHTHAYTLPCMSVFCVCGRDLCEDIYTHTQTMQDQRHTYQGDTQTDMKVMQQNPQQQNVCMHVCMCITSCACAMSCVCMYLCFNVACSCQQSSRCTLHEE